MLAAIRKGAIRIFMGILVLSFAVWGVADFLSGAAQKPLAEVSGEPISGPEFNAEFQREVLRLQRQENGDFDAARARQLGLDKQVLRQMIVRMMFDRHVGEIGLTASDLTVAQSIRDDPNFQDALGQFDRLGFARTLRDNGFSEASFVERVRAEVARRQLIAAITAGAQPPKSMVEAVLRRYNEMREANLLLIPQTAVKAPPKPAEADLEAFYNANPALFTAPETRSVTYLTLTPDTLSSGITVPEEELQNEYQARLAEFTVTGMRNLEQFVLDDEAKANAAMARIRAGGDFHKIAREYSGLEAGDLKLIEITRQDLLPGAADAVFALRERETGGPFKTPLGWQIVKVTALREERVQGFGEVRDRLAREMALVRAGDALVELSNRLEDARAGGATLEEAAAEFGLSLHTIPQIDRSGNDASGNPVSGLPPDDNFIADIFATGAGAESDLRENREGGYYVLRVDKITGPEMRPLAGVRGDVEAGWRARRTGQELQLLAEALLKQAQAGVPLKKISAENKMKMVAAGPFGREYAGEHLSSSAVAKLFSMTPGDTMIAAAPQGGYILAQLGKIIPPDLAAQAGLVSEARKRLGDAMSNDLLAQYQGVLERAYQVSINEEQLSSLADEQ